MAPFRLLDLPSVAADEVLKMATPHELFSLSMHSKQAQNIVKRFANRYKYHLDIDVDKSRIDFNYEKAEKNGLVFEVLLDDIEPTDEVLDFDGCTTQIYANTYFDESNEKNETVVKTFWNGVDRWSGYKCLIEYMSSVFKNMTISIDFGCLSSRATNLMWFHIRSFFRQKNKNSKIFGEIKKALKTVKPKFTFNNDKNGIYTYKPLSELMVNCKHLTIENAKLNNQECKKLVNKWMEGGELKYAQLKMCNLNHINLEHVVPEFADQFEENSARKKQECEIERADGVRVKLTSDYVYFTLQVI